MWWERNRSPSPPHDSLLTSAAFGGRWVIPSPPASCPATCSFRSRQSAARFVGAPIGAGSREIEVGATESDYGCPAEGIREGCGDRQERAHPEGNDDRGGKLSWRARCLIMSVEREIHAARRSHSGLGRVSVFMFTVVAPGRQHRSPPCIASFIPPALTLSGRASHERRKESTGTSFSSHQGEKCNATPWKPTFPPECFCGGR